MEHSQIKTMQKFISSTTNNNNTHVILKNLVQIRTIQQIMLPSTIHKVQTQGLSVFQDETNDKKRKQIVGDQNDPGIAIISNILQEITSNLQTKLYLSQVSILYSSPDCMQQRLHCDFDPTNQNTKKSYFILIAIMDGTKLDISIKNHKATMQLQIGDALLCRGDCVHAGSAYSNENVRLHYYLDAPENRRRINTTYPAPTKNFTTYYERRTDNMFKVNCYKKLKKEKKTARIAYARSFL